MQPMQQPQPYPPGPPGGRPQVSPPGWWFAVGGVLIAVGVIGGAALMISALVGYIGKIDDFDRVDVPGTRTVTLDTGGHTIYHEYSGASSDRPAPSLSVEVTGPDGSPVLLDDYGSDVTYSGNDNEGVALFSFDAEVAGPYEVTTSGSELGTVAVGRGLGSGLVGSIVAGVLVGLVGVVAGIVVLVVVGVRRGRSRRQQMPAPAWGGGYGPPPGGMPPPGGAPPPGQGGPYPPPPGGPPPGGPAGPPGSTF